jgi:hypothetical protein
MYGAYHTGQRLQRRAERRSQDEAVQPSTPVVKQAEPRLMTVLPLRTIDEQTTVKIRFFGPIDPQMTCPLFNGRIPTELRTYIFKLALSEDIVVYNPILAMQSLAQEDFYMREGHNFDELEPPPAPAQPSEQAEDGQQAEAQSEGATASSMTSPHPPSIPPWTRSEDISLGFDWFRPGYTGRKVIHAALLRTCRRVYLETFHFPAQRSHAVYFGREPRWSRGEMRRYFEHDLPKDTARLVREVELFAQMGRLEGLQFMVAPSPVPQRYVSSLTTYPGIRVSAMEALDRVQKMTITIRHRDWWWNESNTPLMIDPFSGGSFSLTSMQTAMAVAMPSAQDIEEGKVPMQNRLAPRAWGAAFAWMPSLKQLVINFETVMNKKSELDAIVAWAKTWRFVVFNDRLDPSRVGDPSLILPPKPGTSLPYCRSWLVAEEAVRDWSWRGLPHHWPETCPACNQRGRRLNPSCDPCRKKGILTMQGRGPRLIVSTVTWNAQRETNSPMVGLEHAAASGTTVNVNAGLKVLMEEAEDGANIDGH